MGLIKMSVKLKSHLLCTFCGYHATQKGSLNNHVRSKHLGIKYECNYCELKLKSKSSLKNHIKVKHDLVKNKIECKLCGKLQSKSNLKFHVNSVHKKIRHKCHLCASEFTQISSVKLHVRTIHEKLKIQCSGCERSFFQASKLKKHMNIVHKNIQRENLKCDLCEYQTVEKASLKLHKEGKHEGKSYSCETCNYTTIWARCLRTHMEEKHGESTPCDKCHKNFASRKHYERHFKRIHSGIELPKIDCTVCGKKMSRENLGTHMKIHGTEFKCKYCDHEAPSMANLKKHLRSVHDYPDKKSHKKPCNICKKVISIRHLKEHEDAVHNNITIPCYICNKSFTRKSHLNAHIKAVH